MKSRPIVLNFSGNDSAGCSGLTMDVRTQTAMGVHSASVITANTAQNSQKVYSINPLSDNAFHDQIRAVSELPIKAVKIGLLTLPEQIKRLQQFVSKKKLPVIFDPVLKSSSGTEFSSEQFVEILKAQLLPCCALMTPNILEAEKLSGLAINNTDDVICAAQVLLSLGVKAVLIKGGHLPSSNNLAQDYFTDGNYAFWISHKKYSTQNTRGTGCLLSSVVASALALNYSLYDAVVIAKMGVSKALKNAYALGLEKDSVKTDNKGPVFLDQFPDSQEDLPVLTKEAITSIADLSSPECNQPVLGLYPVVERAEWVEKLAPSGVSTLQLRVKDLQGSKLEREIQSSVELANKYNIRLFINDYWQLAIKYRAYGVHLGQEDLDTADIEQIKAHGLRLGISTHCHYEVARAHAYQPSYIACGPIYPTTTKDMPWVPHGISGLKYWRKLLHYPLVAIGGINHDRFNDVAGTGVDSVAMITAITLSENPQATATDFVHQFESLQV
jgi:hydroxymethylpyrimidine kinase/phosphomethylpyrimidine kinase/thiamine-phosphate diphosphorylase